MASNIDNYIPMYIRQTEDKRPKNMVTSDHWNELFNLNILQGDAHSEVIVDIIAQLKAAQYLEAAHIARLDNPHGVNNAQVGLGNVTNDKQATKVEFDGHTSNVANPHSVNKTQVGLANVDNTSDANKPVSTAQALINATKVDRVAAKSLVADTEIARLLTMASNAEQNVQSDWGAVDNTSDAYIKNKPALGTAAEKDTGITSGTIPILDANGKLNLSIIPATAITNVKACANIAERDAWAEAAEGDVALVAAPPSSFIRSSTGWLVMPSPTDLVLSVAGRTGVIVLTAADVAGALTVADILNVLTSTSTSKALSAAQGKALKDVCDTLAASLSGFMTTYNGFVSSTNTALDGRVESVTIQSIRYNSGNFEYSTDGATWFSLTGEKGDTGRGYNPRGAWVSGGSYVSDPFAIDVAIYNGTSYYAKTTHSGIVTAPSGDAVNWGILASSGSAATGADVLLTGYAKAGAYLAVSPLDTVNQGIGKVEKVLDSKEPAITKKTAFNVNFDTEAANIKMNGTQSPGVAGTVPRADHVHPVDTSREAAIGTKLTAFNKNYGAISTDVKKPGTQAVGSVDAIARIDHVHPVNSLSELAAPTGPLDMGANTLGFTEYDNGSSGTAKTINWSLSNHQELLLTGNVILTFTAPPKACTLSLKLTQDGNGGRTITLPTIKWPGGSAPTWSTAIGAIDILTLYYDGAAYYGQASLAFA